MDKTRINEIIQRLLEEIEEEDIGISLMTVHYQDENELAFFDPASRESVINMLKSVADDSHRHKKVLDQIVTLLGKIRDEN